MTSASLLQTLVSPGYRRLAEQTNQSQEREVAVAFDREANRQHFYKSFDIQDFWSQRYRKIDIDFKFEPSLTGKQELIESMAFWACSSIPGVVIILVKKRPVSINEGPTSPMTKRILFYSLDPSGRPALISVITCPAFVSELELENLDCLGISDPGPNHVCLTSHCKKWRIHCKFDVRPCFGHRESPIALTIKPFSQPLVEGSLNMNDRPYGPTSGIASKSPFLEWMEAGQGLLGGHGGLWEVLSQPDCRWSSEGFETKSYDGLCHILVAKHVRSKELYIIEVWPYTKRCNLKSESHGAGKCFYDPFHANPIIHIPRPQKQMVFQNVALTSVEHGCLNLSLAVIWADSTDVMRSPVLFVYKFVNTVPRRRSITPAYETDVLLPIHFAMQGRRVGSITRGSGGVHAGSPLRGLPSFTGGASIGTIDITSTGTLRVARPPENNQPTYTAFQRYIDTACGSQNHPVPNVKIILSGSSADDSTHGKVTVFDLNPRVDDIDYPWGSVWRKSSPNFERPRRAVCACALHDRAFAVTLPKAILRAPSGFEWRLRVPFLRPASLGAEEPSGLDIESGATELLASAGRTAAWERLRRRGTKWIEFLMAKGLSDEEIADIWFNGKASFWNLMPKPAGWKDLRP
ncbi:hypothetical protein MMC13_000933 [Lambiella insularis]|nr:hypothetical protein [Lambiella insularis]